MPISDGQDVLLVLVGLPSNITNVVHGTDAFVHDHTTVKMHNGCVVITLVEGFLIRLPHQKSRPPWRPCDDLRL